jgi:hypothetical protein
MIVTLKAAETHCYKGDEPCLACSEADVLRLQLTLDDVEGYAVTIGDGTTERPGFMCNGCVSRAEEDPSITVLSDLGE